ncbi:MAG: DUF4276 family protein [Verrucomicrobiales bacterium]|nr:DUF4276 family protein [Verrucomicrobiales bacterium]
MNTIHVYVEGGGPAKRTQSRLREGFDAFCRELKSLLGNRLRFVVAGSRDEAYQDFRTALRSNPERVNLLLVDLEAAVNGLPRAHLQNRDPHWDLSPAGEDRVHLMAQCLEAWIVADPDALAGYYGQNFNRNALPVRQNLEQELKQSIYAALKNATRQTQKGTYAKVQHARDLLMVVSPQNAQQRCPHCRRFFDTVKLFKHQ